MDVATAAPPRAPAGLSRPAGAPRAAAVVAGLAWCLAVLATALLLTARPPVTQDLWFFVVDATVACVYGLVSAVVLSRRRHPVGWVLAVTAVGGAVAAVAFAAGVLAASGVTALAPLGPLNSVAWVPGTLALFLVVPWLVRDHPLDAWSWTGVAAGASATAVFTLCSALPLPVPLPALALGVAALGAVAAADVVRRWLRGPAQERVGLGWLAVGTAIMAVSFVPLAVPAAAQLPSWTVPVLHLLAQVFFPGAVLVAVLRQRMWGLDLAVSRAVLGGAVVAVLVVLYVVVTAALTSLLPGDGAAHVVGAAAVAVAVQPSRLWLQRRVHRLVHGDGADPTQAVRRLGHQLGGTGSEDLLAGLVRSVADTLRLESAVLVVDGDRVAASGAPTGAPVDVPLVHRGQPVGMLRVTAPPGERLGPRGLRTLGELATVVGAGVALTHATQGLEVARQRLTSARLQERQVIRRELHDGLGPSLAGIRLGLHGARSLVATDPDAAGRLLAALQDELDQRVEDVRQLSRSLLPPALEELGLAAALAELAARHRGGDLDVSTDVDVATALHPATAAAAYGIVAEALTNVVRHSGAARCRVTVRSAEPDAPGAEHALLVVVEDDGCGIGVDAVPGVGSRSMRERAEEQRGSLQVLPAEPHGTRVVARLPGARR